MMETGSLSCPLPPPPPTPPCANTTYLLVTLSPTAKNRSPILFFVLLSIRTRTHKRSWFSRSRCEYVYFVQYSIVGGANLDRSCSTVLYRYPHRTPLALISSLSTPTGRAQPGSVLLLDNQSLTMQTAGMSLDRIDYRSSCLALPRSAHWEPLGRSQVAGSFESKHPYRTLCGVVHRPRSLPF